MFASGMQTYVPSFSSLLADYNFNSRDDNGVAILLDDDAQLCPIVTMAIIQAHLQLFRCSITFFSCIIFNFVIPFFHAALQDSDNYTLLVRHTS
jgi:hypothetical protein